MCVCLENMLRPRQGPPTNGPKIRDPLGSFPKMVDPNVDPKVR